MSNKIMNIEDFPRCLVLDRRVIASTLASGLSPIWLCREFTTAITFIGRLQGGNHLSRRFPAPSRRTWKTFGKLPKVYRTNGGTAIQCRKECRRNGGIKCSPSGLSKLIETLYQRRSSIRQLITNFREHTRNPFPNWKNIRQVSVPAMPAESQECRV